MATNKHAQIRYLALDKCFANFGRKFYIQDLVEACNQAIYDFTGKHDGVKKRQVYDDITFMESSQGWSVELDRQKDGRNVWFRYKDWNYSINKSPLNQVELSQFKEVLFTLSRFRGMPQFEWIDDISSRLESLTKGSLAQADKVIDFEQNQYLKGLELISPLFNAIINKRVLEITYTSFKSLQPVSYVCHPYFLKQYNLRWFLFGLTEPAKQITNLSLDRIILIKECSIPYIENTAVDFGEYFEDVIGVSIPADASAERILLKVSRELWPYIETKPLHGSQKAPRFTEEGVFIELSLLINYELISRLMSFGDGLTVIEPKHLVDGIIQRVEAMRRNYL